MALQAQHTMKCLLLFIMASVVGLLAHPQSASAMFNGEAWQTLSRAEKHAYIAGVVDGWQNVVHLASMREHVPEAENVSLKVFGPIVSCIEAMNYEQITAIVERHLNEHRNNAHHAMTGIVWSGLTNACRKERRDTR
jgi:hypothetical protein